jgi:membrane protein implicated in regulation of membrane protease activity
VAVGIGVALVSQWWIGLVVAAAMFVVPYVTGGRLLLTAGAPLALAIGALFDIPELGWLALGLLAADLVVGWWRGRGNTTPPPDPPAAPGS